MTTRATLRKHAVLMDDMATKVGVDLEEAAIAGALEMDEIADAVERCTQCTSPTACTRWLGQHESAETTPDYCRNADLFERLRPR